MSNWMSQLKELHQWMPKAVTRTGIAADLATFPHTTDMFTVTGDILVMGIYGKVIAQKDGTGQFLTLRYTPTGGGAIGDLCLVSPTTTGDVINSIYTITGVSTDAMIVAQIGPAIGIGQFQGNALGTIKSELILAAGIIHLLATVAADANGLINWTVLYRPLTAVSRVTVL